MSVVRACPEKEIYRAQELFPPRSARVDSVDRLSAGAGRRGRDHGQQRRDRDPWHTEADGPACFGPDGRTLGAAILDAHGRCMRRLCPSGTSGGGQAVAGATMALASRAAAIAAIETVSRPPTARRAGQEDANNAV